MTGSPAKACGLLHEFASSHNIASFTVKPAATANMKEDFLTTNRKVMGYTFAGDQEGPVRLYRLCK